MDDGLLVRILVRGGSLLLFIVHLFYVFRMQIRTEVQAFFPRVSQSLADVVSFMHARLAKRSRVNQILGLTAKLMPHVNVKIEASACSWKLVRIVCAILRSMELLL